MPPVESLSLKDLKSLAKTEGMVGVSRIKKMRLRLILERGPPYPWYFMPKSKIGGVCKKNKMCYSKHCVRDVCSPKPKKSCLQVNTVSPQEHQSRVAEFINDKARRGLYVHHSTGSGKSITALLSANCYLSKHPKHRVIILTPSSVTVQFRKEAEKLGIETDRLTIESHGRWIKSKDTAKNALVVVDEAHKFTSRIRIGNSNPTGRMAYNLIEKCKKAHKVLLMSATPIKNNLMEFANMYAILKNVDHKKAEKIMTDAIEKEDLAPILECSISQYTPKAENFPLVREHEVPFTMTKDYLRKYLLVEDSAIDAMKTQGMWNGFVDSKNLRAFFNGIRRAANTVGAKNEPKIKWTVNHIKKNVMEKKRTLVYSNWLATGIEPLKKKLDAMKIKNMVIHGTVAPKKRAEISNAYNTGQIPVLFITSAAAEGLDLKQTRSVIIVEPHWNKSKIDQVRGRAARYKSHEGLSDKDRIVDVYHLILRKPKGGGGIPHSADTLLQKMSADKMERTDHFAKVAKKMSIEERKCGKS